MPKACCECGGEVGFPVVLALISGGRPVFSSVLVGHCVDCSISMFFQASGCEPLGVGVDFPVIPEDSEVLSAD